MLAAARCLRVSSGPARALIEGSVLIAGAVMGGKIGPGTVLFAVAIGPAINASFRLFRVEPPRRKHDDHPLKRAGRLVRRGQEAVTRLRAHATPPDTSELHP